MPAAPAAQVPAKKEGRVGADESLREVERLAEEEPVIRAHRDARIDRLEHVEGRHDIEEGHAFDRVGVVKREPVGDAAAPIVPGHGETLEPKLTHHLDHVLCESALRIRRVARLASRLRARPVAAQVGTDHGVGVGESWRHGMPHDVRLRISVKEEKRRPAAAAGDVNMAARRLDTPRDEPCQHGQ